MSLQKARRWRRFCGNKPKPFENKNAFRNGTRFLYGGEGGIRTRGRVNPDTHLAGGPNQPLWHLPNLVVKLGWTKGAEGVGFEPT